MKEKFAKLAHEQWSGWMDYIFSKCTKTDAGELIIPKWAVDRWKKQANIPYSELTTAEMDSDRKEADKFLSLLEPEPTEFTKKCRDLGVNPQKFNLLSWRQVLFIACDIIDRQAKSIKLLKQCDDSSTEVIGKLDIELKAKDKLLEETLEVFNAEGTHHGGTMRIFGLEYLRKFALKVKQALKGNDG